MDQQKIGRFIKELRKEKGLTQEKTAEQFHVSRRTVSRWETGSNLPDLDVLIEMADYFEVDLRELLHSLYRIISCVMQEWYQKKHSCKVEILDK